jgi:hypothetical protein
MTEQEALERLDAYLRDTWMDHWFRQPPDDPQHMSGFYFAGWVGGALENLTGWDDPADAPPPVLPWPEEAAMWEWYEAVLWPHAVALHEELRAEDGE